MTFVFDLEDESKGMTQISVDEKRMGLSWKLEETDFSPDFGIKTRFQNDFVFDHIWAWVFPNVFDLTFELDTPSRSRREVSNDMSYEVYFDLITTWRAKEISHRVTTNTYVDIGENSGDVRFILSNSLNSG